MHSSTFLLLVAASLSLAATDCGMDVVSCISSVNLASCAVDSTMFPDPCGCSKASRVAQCYDSFCSGQPQSSIANSAYTAVCLGTTVHGIIGATGTNTLATATAAATSTNTLATATAAAKSTDTLVTSTTAATGTGTTGGVTTAPAGGSGSGSTVGAGGSAAPASTSKAWGERSLVLPAGGAMAAVLGLAILL